MSEITSETTLEELAALVSQALDRLGITATLSGGAAVSVYTDNAYQSADLDFVSFEQLKNIEKALKPLGFYRVPGARQFEHAATSWYVEFPPGPLAFGDTTVPEDQARVLETAYGPLRIVTPTQAVMDRLAAYVFWGDNPSLDQAAMVAARQEIDWTLLTEWVASEGIEPAVISKLEARLRRFEAT